MILDVGSGGTFECEPTRGDVCIDLIKRPKNRPPNFVCGDGYHLPFADHMFDHVNCFEVIEHLESPIALIREIYRTLKPFGKATFSTPNVFFYRSMLRELRGKHPILGGHGHIGTWTVAELTNLLGTAGFVKFSVSYDTWSYMQRTHPNVDRIAKLLLPRNATEMNIVVNCVKTAGLSKSTEYQEQLITVQEAMEHPAISHSTRKPAIHP